MTNKRRRSVEPDLTDLARRCATTLREAEYLLATLRPAHALALDHTIAAQNTRPTTRAEADKMLLQQVLAISHSWPAAVRTAQRAGFSRSGLHRHMRIHGLRGTWQEGRGALTARLRALEVRAAKLRALLASLPDPES
jgi:hypothetical protein